MENDISKEKNKTEDILLELDNLKKCITNLTNNVNSEKIESFIDAMNRNVNNLQNEVESFYNEKYTKIVNNESE